MGKANCHGLGHRGSLDCELEPALCNRKLRHTISSFVEAMFWIAVAGKDGHLMTTVLQSYSSINDESFGTSYPQVRMEE